MTRPPRHAPSTTLAAIAERAGCGLTEFQDGMDTNPPVNGEFVERNRARDGSYAGERPPSLSASIHALYHGRVLLQYRPDLPADAASRASSDWWATRCSCSRTRPHAGPVAATAYLSVMTCPRVDARTLAALEAFRDRRRAFGQGF